MAAAVGPSRTTASHPLGSVSSGETWTPSGGTESGARGTNVVLVSWSRRRASRLDTYPRARSDPLGPTTANVPRRSGATRRTSAATPGVSSGTQRRLDGRCNVPTTPVPSSAARSSLPSTGRRTARVSATRPSHDATPASSPTTTAAGGPRGRCGSSGVTAGVWRRNVATSGPARLSSSTSVSATASAVRAASSGSPAVPCTSVTTLSSSGSTWTWSWRRSSTDHGSCPSTMARSATGACS